MKIKSINKGTINYIYLFYHWVNRLDIKILSCRTGVATEGGYFGPGSGMILLDSVRCQGTERSLSQCRNDGWGISNCEHSEDVGVICDAPPATIATTTNRQGSGIDF